MAKKEDAKASVHETVATESCIKYFDAAWFCFTPAHQIQNYYIHGEWDSCQETLSDLFRCFGGKTRLYKGEAPRHLPCIWESRTRDEAQKFWQEEFCDVFDDST